MALKIFSLKKCLTLNLFLLLLQSHSSLYAEQEPITEKAVTEQQSANTNSAADSPASQEEATNLSKILDPTKRQFMHGQLAYWFKDYASALKLWQPLAEKGDPKSQATLGWLYHQGLGVTQSYQIAVEWYQKSAMQDYTLAQHNLGMMYENGWGVQQDYKEALKWYKLGADKAYGNSVYNLGLMYLNGLGTAKDKEKAIHLFKSAHRLQVQDASAILRELNVEAQEPNVHSLDKIPHSLPPE